MKLRLDNITQPVDIQIAGNEDWLEPIYGSFFTPPGQTPPKIEGHLRVEREIDELFKVSGQLSFTPWVDCSRCGDPIRWDVSGRFSYRAIPEEMDEIQDGSGERSFAYPDEDILTYQDFTLNLAEVINDQIQLAIPLQTINRSENGEGCRDCGRSLESTAVFHDEKDKGAEPRPFDVLKNLKL